MKLPYRLISGVSGVAIAAALVIVPGSPVSVTDAIAGGPGNKANVRVKNPHNNENVSGVFDLEAAVGKRANVDSVTFSVADFTAKKSFVIGTDTDGSDGWSVPWDTSLSANGDSGVSAKAYDSSGQVIGTSRGVMAKVAN